MAKHTSVYTMEAANSFIEVSALANCIINIHTGDSFEWAVADAEADIDTVGELAAAHRFSIKDRQLKLTGLGTKKVFVRGAVGTQVVVTAYA